MFISYISTDSIGSLIKRFAAKKAGVEDGEINNQRKAFLDMLAWSEGTDNGRRKPEIMNLWPCRVGGELFTGLDHPRKTCHAKPKAGNQQAPDATSFTFRWWDAYHKQLGLKDFSPKSQDAVALQQIEAWRFTYD